jgi:two-component sensor histidine kinase
LIRLKPGWHYAYGCAASRPSALISINDLTTDGVMIADVPTGEGARMNRDNSKDDDANAIVMAAPCPPTGRCEDCWIIEEADHRIANHLTMLAGFVQLKSNELSRDAKPPTLEDVQFTLQSVRLQINVTARLHRTLSSVRRVAVLDLGDQLRELCTALLSMAPGKFELDGDFSPGCLIGVAKVLPLSCMVAEVVTNALKYAGSPDGACLVKVSCHATNGGAVMIEIVDDGPGLPAGFDPDTDGGLGFRLLRALSKQLGARITFESSPQGVRFQAVLPSG